MAREWAGRRMRWDCRLRQAMEDNGVNGRQLAALSGVSYSMIRQILVGLRQGTPEMQADLADALGEDPGWVFPRNPTELERARSWREVTDLGTTRKRPGLEVAHAFVGRCEDTADL